MRADTGTPELGITGVDLASFVPAGNRVMRFVARGVEQPECQARNARFRCEQTLLALANGRNDNTNSDLVEEKSRRQDGRRIPIEAVA
jgi:hypothetical protein